MAAIVKTVNGLALANIKTFNGLAAASLKTINGQDATATSGEYVKKDEQTTNNDYDYFGDSGTNTMVGSSFTTGSAYSLRRVSLLLYRTGSPTFNLTVQIFADNGSGIPTGSALATSASIAASTLSTTAANVDFDFATGLSLSNATKYHIMIVPSTYTDASNYVNLRMNYNGATGQNFCRQSGGNFSVRYSDTQLVFATYTIA